MLLRAKYLTAIIFSWLYFSFLTWWILNVKDEDASAAEQLAPHARPKGGSQPAIQRPIWWHAPFLSGGGYSTEAVEFVLGLHRSDLVAPGSLWLTQHGDLESEEVLEGMDPRARRDLLGMLGLGHQGLRMDFQQSIVICHSVPGAWAVPVPQFQATPCPPSPLVAYRVGRTMFEAEGLHPDHVERCNAMDEIWVPTEFHRQLYRRSGVTVPRLEVIPEPVDTDVFDPGKHIPLPLPIGRLVFGRPIPPHTRTQPQHHSQRRRQRQRQLQAQQEGEQGEGRAGDLGGASGWECGSQATNVSKGWLLQRPPPRIWSGSSTGGRRRMAAADSGGGGTRGDGGEGGKGGSLQPNSGTKRSKARRKGGGPLFVFLSIFKWEERKGWDVLLRAYLQEFDPGEAVALLLLTHPFHREAEDFVGEMRGWAGDQARRGEVEVRGTMDWRALPAVYVQHQHVPQRDLPRLYKAADAFVLPSRGEGWGRPHVEAMSMGLPVIATNWSGPTAFLDPGVGYPLAVDGLVPAPLDDAGFAGLRWAQPSATHLRQLMREVFKDRRGASARGRAARARMVERYTPRAVAQQVADRLSAIDESVGRASGGTG